MDDCKIYDKLRSSVEEILTKISRISSLLLETFRAQDLEGVHRLDIELELAVGQKERSIGALRQHVEEHKCGRAPI